MLKQFWWPRLWRGHRWVRNSRSPEKCSMPKRVSLYLEQRFKFKTQRKPRWPTRAGLFVFRDLTESKIKLIVRFVGFTELVQEVDLQSHLLLSCSWLNPLFLPRGCNRNGNPCQWKSPFTFTNWMRQPFKSKILDKTCLTCSTGLLH